MKIRKSISEIQELENIEEHQSVDIATLVRVSSSKLQRTKLSLSLTVSTQLFLKSYLKLLFMIVSIYRLDRNYLLGSLQGPYCFVFIICVNSN